MKRTLYIFLFLWLLVPIGRANEVQETVACGRWVTLTATPDKGYHFVRWSDGNTDNPRRMYISGDVDVQAEFARSCDELQFPVLRLYDWVLMLNVDSLHRAGYRFEESDVTWYRIVGGTDVPLSTGYYLTMDQSLVGTGSYYATVALRGAPLRDYICDSLQRTEIVDYEWKGRAPTRQPELHPTQVRLGEQMMLTGLRPDRPSHVLVYDVSGRIVADFTTDGEERIPLTAAMVEGVYLVRVEEEEQYWILRYVATH